jgi:hypothetical protein
MTTLRRKSVTTFAAIIVFGLLTCGARAIAEQHNVPPDGFVSLFNGKDLTGWKGLPAPPNDNPIKRAKLTPAQLAAAQKEANDNMRAHWKVADGALVFDGGGRSLCTVKDYADFELLVDWKILPKGDSGIYLRGTPQVQIWDNSAGSGGLFNNQKNPSKPAKVADRPVGEWNRFRIRMVGEKVTVWLNDELVVENVTMENYWDRTRPIFPTGQIELQNHGNTLWFKNIYVRELGAAPASSQTSRAGSDDPLLLLRSRFRPAM